MSNARLLPKARTSLAAPNLAAPKTILDLPNYCLTRIADLAGSLVTRICEGEFAVTRREWRFVALLAAFGELSPSELAELGTLDRPRTSKALTSLMLKKLIQRTPAARDGRHVTVKLTATGRQLYEQIFPRSAEINLALIESLSRADRKTLGRLLAALQSRAEDLVRLGIVQVRTDRRGGGSRRRWEVRTAERKAHASIEIERPGQHAR
jgi:DNA-binding MarR family transcriptional regulator